MNVTQIRRANLESLIARAGGPTKFADKIGKGANYVIQLRSRKKSFGDKIARDIERSLRKADGWMDNMHEGVSYETPAAETAPPHDGQLRLDPESIDFQNDTIALRMIVSAIALVIANSRPTEGAAIEGIFRSEAIQKRPEVLASGFGKTLVEALAKIRRAAELSAKGP